MNLLAQAIERTWFKGGVGTWSFGEFLVALVILSGAIAIAYIAFKKMGWAPPDWLIQMVVVVIVVVVAVFLIRFLLTM